MGDLYKIQTQKAYRWYGTKRLQVMLYAMRLLSNNFVASVNYGFPESHLPHHFGTCFVVSLVKTLLTRKAFYVGLTNSLPWDFLSASNKLIPRCQASIHVKSTRLLFVNTSS